MTHPLGPEAFEGGSDNQNSEYLWEEKRIRFKRTLLDYRRAILGVRRAAESLRTSGAALRFTLSGMEGLQMPLSGCYDSYYLRQRSGKWKMHLVKPTDKNLNEAGKAVLPPGRYTVNGVTSNTVSVSIPGEEDQRRFHVDLIHLRYAEEHEIVNQHNNEATDETTGPETE